jgi:hypothetical protein
MDLMTLLYQFQYVSVSKVKCLSFSNISDIAALLCFVSVFEKVTFIRYLE